MSSNRWEKEIKVMGLIGSCTFANPLPSCVLVQVRELSLESVEKYIRQLPESDLDAIIDAHLRCAAAREAGVTPDIYLKEELDD